MKKGKHDLRRRLEIINRARSAEISQTEIEYQDETDDDEEALAAHVEIPDFDWSSHEEESLSSSEGNDEGDETKSSNKVQ